MKSHNGWFALPCRGFLAHPPARWQANAMLDQRLVEVGVDPRVNRLVADRMALGVRRIVHRSHCATCLHAQAPADLAGRAPLRQISKHAAGKNLVAVQEPLLGAAPGHLRRSPGVLGPIRPIRTAVAAISRHTTEGLRPIKRAIHTWDKPASNPTIIAARSSTLNIRRQLTTSPSNSTATTQIAYTL